MKGDGRDKILDKGKNVVAKSRKEKEKIQRAEISPTTPGLEWAVSAFGLAIVTMMLAFICYSGVREGQTPPEVSVKVLSVKPSGSGVLVQIRAENKGTTTAAGLTIEGVVKEGSGDDGKDLETSTVTFDYLPSHSSREGGVFFSKDLGENHVVVRAVGYQVP